MSPEAIRIAIDRASAEWAKAVEEVVADRFVSDIVDLVKRGATREQIAEALSRMDVAAHLQQQLRPALESLTRTYRDGILANMSLFAPITDSTLEALVRIDTASILSQLDGIAGELKKTIAQRVLAGATEAELRAAAADLAGVKHAETLVNTTLNTFSRTVTQVMAEKAPAERKYRYEGPVDGRTRPICLKMVAAGDLTLAEIQTQFPGSMQDGGGDNCRHGWRPVESTVRSVQAQAQALVDERGGLADARTPLQQLRERGNAA